MAWGLDRAQLEAGREEMRARAEERPTHRVLEQLARAHRWLDEDDEARQRFRAAAADLDERIEQRGRGSAHRRGQTGGLLRLAGDDEAARDWLERALGSLDAASPSDAGQVAELRYLLGDDAGAQEAAARAEEVYSRLESVVDLARARERADPDAAAAARDRIALALHADRTPPSDESGQRSLGAWDWLEEAFRVEAGLRGEAVPSHAEMLERAGLSREAGAARDDAPAPAPAQGRHEIVRTAPGGAQVEPTAVVDEHGNVVLRVDPREDVQLCVRLLAQFGELVVRIEWIVDGDEDEVFEDDLADRYPSVGTACDAAADWLRAYAPDPPGGAWAAETVRALAAVL